MAAQRDASLRRVAAHAQGPTGHRKGHAHRCVECSRLEIRNGETTADVGGLIFIDGPRRRRRGHDRLVDVRCIHTHRGRRDIADDVAGNRHGVAVPGVFGSGHRCIGGPGFDGVVQRAAVGARRKHARRIAQPVVGDHLDLVDRVAVAAEGDREAGERRIHLGARAPQCQVVACAVLVTVACGAPQCGGADRDARVITGAERRAGAVEQPHRHLNEVLLTRRDRDEVGVGHAEACDRVVGRDRAGKSDRAGRCRHDWRVVGRRNVDPELVVRLFATAVGQRESELVVLPHGIRRAGRFGAVVHVEDPTGFDVGLGERRVDAEHFDRRAAIGGVRDVTVCRRARDAVLHLCGGAVGVVGLQERRADDGLAAFVHMKRIVGRRMVGWGCDGIGRVRRHHRIGQVRPRCDRRRVVDVGDLDIDRAGVRRSAPAVDGVQIERGAARLRAVADEAQARGAGVAGDQRCIDERRPDDDVVPLAAAIGGVLQDAACWRSVDDELQRVGAGRIVVHGVVGTAARKRRSAFEVGFAGRIVRV